MPTLHLLSSDGLERTIDLATLTLPAVIGRDSELSQVVLIDGHQVSAVNATAAVAALKINFFMLCFLAITSQ